MAHALTEAMAKHGLTVKAEFVPWSRSRNAGEKDERGNPRHSLNWKVTLERNGRPVLTTDYSAGAGHCPAYNKKPPANWDRPARFWQFYACEWECENGFEARYTFGGFNARTVPVSEFKSRKIPIEPKPESVVHSLIMDSDVLDYAKFEDWAREMGFDPDSRKGETVYRACLEIALTLRSGLGESVLAELREAGQDY